MVHSSPESAGAGAPESKDDLSTRFQGLQEKNLELKQRIGKTKPEGRDALLTELKANEKQIKQVEKDMKALVRGAKQSLNQAGRIEKRDERLGKGLNRLGARYKANEKRLGEIKQALSEANIANLGADEITKLTKEQEKLGKEQQDIMGVGGKMDVRSERIDRRIYGDFDEDGDEGDRADLVKKAKAKRAEAQSALAEIQELQGMGLGDDPELKTKIARLETQLKDADDVIAAHPTELDEGADEKKDAKESDEEIETNHEKMVRITVNLARYLSVNPPLEGESFNGMETVEMNVAEMAFYFVLGRSGEEGLKAIQDQLGPDVEQKLKDYMGFVIESGFDEAGNPVLKHRFDDDLKNETAIAELKALREGSSLKTGPEKALERSGKKMKRLGRDAMRGMLDSGNLKSTLDSHELGMNSSLFDFMTKALTEESDEMTDKSDVQAMVSKAFANVHLMNDVRESLKDLEGDELDKALVGLGLNADEYKEAAKDELTDEELRGLLAKAVLAPEQVMFKGQTVGDVVKDLYTESGEEGRAKLREHFNGDDEALKLFDEQDKTEKESGVKDMVQMVLQEGEENLPAVREVMMKKLKEAVKDNSLGIPEGSDLTGEMKVLDFFLQKQNSDANLSMEPEEKIRILSATDSPVVALLSEGLDVSDSDSQKLYGLLLKSIQDYTLGEVFGVKKNELLRPAKTEVSPVASPAAPETVQLDGPTPGSWSGVRRLGPPPIYTDWQI